MVTTWNQEEDLVDVYKGVFGIYDGTELFNFDHPLSIEILDQADTEKFYSASGKKRKRSIGNSSTFKIIVKKTSDLYDDADPAVEVKTISYFRKKISELDLPTGIFEGLDESDSSSNEFIRYVFTATIETIRDVPREEGLAAQYVEIAGEILTYTKTGQREES